jgi:hypothetical protein
MPRHLVAEIEALAASSTLSIRKIQDKLGRKASCGTIGEITRLVRSQSSDTL